LLQKNKKIAEVKDAIDSFLDIFESNADEEIW
jgi:hypothetical protein